MIIHKKRAKTSFWFLWGTISVVVLAVMLLELAVHPVRADQITMSPAGDAFVASGKPTQNFATNSGLWVGYGRPGGYSLEKSLLGFDTTAIPKGSHITSAALSLYLAGTTSGDTPLAVQACRVRSSWTEEKITWDGYLGLDVDCASAASTDVPPTLGPYLWDVKGALQAWSSEASDTGNFSLILQSDVTSGQHYRGFWSKDCSPAACGSNRPYLEITYDPPPPLQVSLSQKEQTGGQLRYDITVVNPSTQIASSVVINNPVPAGTAYDSATNGGTLIGSVVKWAPGTLGPGIEWHGSYTVTISSPLNTADQLSSPPLAAGDPRRATGALITNAAHVTPLELPAADHPDIQISKAPDTRQVISGGTAKFTSAVTDTITGPGNSALTGVTAGITSTATTIDKPSAGPAILITKAPDTQQVVAGGTANFHITVENIGTVVLNDVVVDDPKAPDCDRLIDTLAVGNNHSYDCALTNVTADLQNLATATGTPPTGPNVDDSDIAAVQVFSPAIQITKSPDPQSVVAGGRAKFDIVVTNVSSGSGNLTLTNVTVSDPKSPDCNRNNVTLQAGANHAYSYECTLTNVTADFANEARVTGTPAVGPNVKDFDTAGVVVTTPPKPPIIVNHGACVGWQYPDGKPLLSCSNPAILNPLQLWLPLVLRN
jgi:uncharacterized repeat protein (TIGR01451 family)